MKSFTCLPVLFVLGMGSSALAQFNFTVDDADSSIAYTRSPAWNKDVRSQQLPQPLDGTNHDTQEPGASVTFQFTGTAVYVYGYKGPNNGFRNISVDSGTAVQCDGRTGQLGSRALLFSTSGLSHGHHTVTVTHTGMAGEHLNIDYFLVTAGGDAAMLVARDIQSSHSSIPIIAGAASGGVVILLAVLMIIFYSIGRRRRNPEDANVQHVLTKRSSAPMLPRPRSTHDPSSTMHMLSSHPSSYLPHSSNPSAVQDYNPYQNHTPPMSVQFSEPRGTSVYSSLAPQNAQTISSRRSPDSRPMSTGSQPSLRSGSYPQGGGYAGVGTTPRTMGYDVNPESLRMNSYPQGGGYGGGGGGTGPPATSHDANPESSRPSSHQQGGRSYGGAATGPLATVYDTNPELLRPGSYQQGGGNHGGAGRGRIATARDANPEPVRSGSYPQGAGIYRGVGQGPVAMVYDAPPEPTRSGSYPQTAGIHGGAAQGPAATVHDAHPESLRSGAYQQGAGAYGGAGTGPLVMSYDANAEQARYTHLPEKRRPEEMDPVYQSPSVSSSAPPNASVPSRTYRVPGTEQDGMPPPPKYHKGNRE